MRSNGAARAAFGPGRSGARGRANARPGTRPAARGKNAAARQAKRKIRVPHRKQQAVERGFYLELATGIEPATC